MIYTIYNLKEVRLGSMEVTEEEESICFDLADILSVENEYFSYERERADYKIYHGRKHVLNLIKEGSSMENMEKCYRCGGELDENSVGGACEECAKRVHAPIVDPIELSTSRQRARREGAKARPKPGDYVFYQSKATYEGLMPGLIIRDDSCGRVLLAVDYDDVRRVRVSECQLQSEWAKEMGATLSEPVHNYVRRSDLHAMSEAEVMKKHPYVTEYDFSENCFHLYKFKKGRWFLKRKVTWLDYHDYATVVS